MAKLRLIFIISLVILAVVLMATLLNLPGGEDYPESRRAQLIQAEDGWILQYDIVNNQQQDIAYTIEINIDDTTYTDGTLVRAGKAYTYIHHIYPQQVGEGEITFTLYQAGQAEPVDRITYYLQLK